MFRQSQYKDLKPIVYFKNIKTGKYIYIDNIFYNGKTENNKHMYQIISSSYLLISIFKSKENNKYENDNILNNDIFIGFIPNSTKCYDYNNTDILHISRFNITDGIVKLNRYNIIDNINNSIEFSMHDYSKKKNNDSEIIENYGIYGPTFLLN